MLSVTGGALEDTLESVGPQSEADVLLLAIAKEKVSFVRLAAAAQACADLKARRLYNQLALDGLKHLLTLVSLMDGLADDWLAQLDLRLPLTDLPDPLSQTQEALLRFTTEIERTQSFFSRLAKGADREELSSLMEHLRDDEEDHRTRLLSRLHGMEAGRPVAARRLPAWL